MRKLTVIAVALLGLVLGSIAIIATKYGHLFVSVLQENENSEQVESFPLPPPTVSRETTFVTEPIDDEGFVDYLEALNRAASVDVTSDNNAAVLFAEADMGILKYSPAQRRLYCEKIGIEPKSAAKIPFAVRRNSAVDEDPTLKRALSGSWNSNELPDVFDWIESNSAALELIIQGTKRPKCYIPLLPEESSETSARLVNVLLPVHQASREVARCLCARANLRLGQGNLTLAKDDLIACHRLGRQMGYSPFLICALVANSNDSIACTGDTQVLQSGLLDAVVAKDYLRELQQLPPLPAMADKLDFGERLSILEMLTSMHFLDSGSNVEAIENLQTYRDAVLRACNARFDAFVAAMRLSKNSERLGEEQRLLEQLRQLLPPNYQLDRNKSLDAYKIKIREELAGHPPAEVGRAIGDIQVSLLFPNIRDTTKSETRARVRNDLIGLGFELLLFKWDTGKFPRSLDDLTPTYVASLPIDAYSDKSFHYQTTNSGCKLWSVGLDSVDHTTQGELQPAMIDDIILELK